MKLEKLTLQEVKKLLSNWSAGTFPTVAASVKYHFRKHGVEVSAQNIGEYLRKADALARRLRGARKSYLNDSAIRYTKNGLFIIKNIEGKILSFGSELKSNER
jgi:hypothetical protein